ncbi:MAG TPA: sulfite exporter TauE/SafE family protein [Candidatus Limnocylindria bacterium]|nr:sulfite exporter TauE/SafE family protein [Candidatus Limnocylindria bacterium]
MPFYEMVVGAVAVAAGAVAAVAGFGIGSLLTPALAVSVGTRLAVALVALPHLVATAYRLWLMRREIDRKVLHGFGLASAAGGLLGAVLHGLLASALLAVVLGVLLILAGLLELSRLGRRLMLGGRLAVAAGVLSGVFGGLVGNQGGIRSAALLRFNITGPALVATSTATGLLVDLARVPVYLVTTGGELLEHWPTIVLLTAGVLVGTIVGAPVLRRLPERQFRRLLALLLIGLGVLLIVDIRQ